MRTLTFLFADLREYTAFVERHGDIAATTLIGDYRRLVRAEVARAEGAEVKTEGDSFYVVFEAASDAVRCATAVLGAAERYSRERPERPMRVGIGIHSGEPQPHEGQYVGGAVVVAARLAQQADAGELLISDVVRGLLPRGEAPPTRERVGLTLKGISDPPRAFSVRWSVAEPLARAGAILGREEELSAIGDVLADPAARLLTLTGPGGIGKTRLAVAAAERAAERLPDGARFVDLSTVRDPSLVASAIAEALHVVEGPARSLTKALLAELRDREMLLVLDNFEQVLGAVPLVASLLAECPHLLVLVTSRQPLRSRDERVIVVPPLATDPAVALFMERARATGAPVRDKAEDREAAAEICRRLDGLPLAIELAAARARHFSPRALLGRLQPSLPLLEHGPRDAPERQRTLTAAIAWSYDLLDPPQRAVFRRSSVFAGGSTAVAAAAVAALGDIEPAEMFDLLTALADQSLLLVAEDREGEPRFRALETVREFAFERLRESGEEPEVRRRHARYFGALAEEARPHLEQADQSVWLERLYREHANLRAALLWAVEASEAEWGLRLAAQLWPFWFMRGALTEGRERIADLLAAGSGPVDPRVRASALNAAGLLARYQRDYGSAEKRIAQGLEIRRGLGDPKEIADSLNNLAYVTLHRGDHHAARSLYGEALRTYRALGEEQGVADAQSHLALIALQERDIGTARRLEQESLAIWRRLGDMQGVTWALEGLGKVELEAGDLEAAVASFREGLDIAKSLGHGWAIALLVDAFACAAVANGQAERALRLAGAAAAIRKRVGTPLAPLHERQLHRWLERARHALRPAHAEEAYAAGSALPEEDAVAQAMAEAAAAPISIDPRRPDRWSGLSEREREVAALIAQGLTNKQIGERLFIASGTADRHVANILGKLEMRNRAQVAAWVAERGLLQEP